MRRWLSLTTVLALLLCVRGDARVRRITDEEHKSLDPCPTDSVCVIFSDDKCTVRGVETGIYIWEDKTPEIECEKGTYGWVYARLDIHPVSVTKWKVVATLIKDGRDKVNEHVQKTYNPEEFRFNFNGKSELKFLSSNGTEFSWNEAKTLETSGRHISKNNEFTSSHDRWYNIRGLGSWKRTLTEYTFDIETNGEKLLDLIGPELTCHIEYDKGHQIFQLNDTAFPERINQLTNCDLSEIKEICYDTCDKIFSGSNSSSNSTDSTESSTDKSKPSRITSCPSNLWFHSPSDGGMTRQWKKISNLKCDMGWWQGNTTNGIQKIHSSMELQCSGPEPSKLTSLGKILIGVGAGIGGLLLVGGIVLAVFFLNKKKRGENFGGNTEKKFTIRDSDSRAQTPGTPGGKSTEREKN